MLKPTKFNTFKVDQMPHGLMDQMQNMNLWFFSLYPSLSPSQKPNEGASKYVVNSS